MCSEPKINVETPKNHLDTTKILAETLSDLKNKKVGSSEASAVSRLAGAMIYHAKVKLDYNIYMHKVDPIVYLEDK